MLPALRERIEDLPLLIESLLQRVASGRRLRLSEAALAVLSRYDFPGNIRELRNILERAALLCDGRTILPEHLPDECRRSQGSVQAAAGMPSEILPLDDMGRRYLLWALARFHGDKRSLSERLGISERTLYRKLQGARYK